MNIFEIAAKLSALRNTLEEKLPDSSTVNLEIRLNYLSSRPVYFYGYVPDWADLPPDQELCSGSEVEDFLILLENGITALPTRDEMEKRVAVKKLGEAIDGVKAVGLDTDALSEAFSEIYDNLLEYKG